MSGDDLKALQRSADAALKVAAKEAIKEFLDEKFAALGKWSFGSFLALGLAALVYFILTIGGWHK